MTATALPRIVIWDLTYACPLRCVHCYSESGRRASRHMSVARQLQLADVLVGMAPRTVLLSGGEPLLVPGLLDIAARLQAGGIKVALYTSGSGLDADRAAAMAERSVRVHVSLDGPNAEIHDSIRGRPGAFDEAIRALRALDDRANEDRRHARAAFEYGIEVVVLKRNFSHLRAYCTDLAPRFSRLDSIAFGAAVPSGLANRPGFEDAELLADEQWAAMDDPRFADDLQRSAPSSCHVTISSNRALQMHPADVESGAALKGVMQVEPDGAVRAMPIYEGTVGNLLEESPHVLWRRAQARCEDDRVAAALRNAVGMKGWAEAARQIDRTFASASDLVRIARRAPYRPA